MKKLILLFSACLVSLALSAQNDTIVNEDFSSGSIPAAWSVSHQPDTIKYIASHSDNDMVDALYMLNHENNNSDGIYIYPSVEIPIPDGGASGEVGVSLEFDAHKSAIRSYLSFKDNAGTVMAQIMIGDEGHGDGSGVYFLGSAVAPPTASRNDATSATKIYTHTNSKSHTYKFEFNLDNNTVSIEIEGSVKVEDSALFFDASELGSIEFVAGRGWSGSDTRFYLDDIMVVEYASSYQSITFNPIDPVHIDNAVDIVLEENSSAGLPITYASSDESVATIINGYTIHPVGVGKATISANQAGDATYDAALEVTQDIFFVGDTTTYYIREDGDNANDGLSESAALATLAQGILEVKANAMSSVYILDVEGTITGSAGNVVFNQSEDITLIVDGNGVGTMQATDDVTWNAAATNESGGAGGRFFGGPYNNGSGGLTIILEELNIKNAGYTDTNGGVIFNMNVGGKTANAVIRRCNVSNLMARSGAIAHAVSSPYSLSIEDSYFNNIITINNGAYGSPIFVNKKSVLSVTNSVFDGIKKSADQNGSSMDHKAEGSILYYNGSVSGTSLEIINNTFINNQGLRAEMTADQSTIYINPGLAGVPVTIANNLFVGNGAATTTASYYDVNIAGSNAPTLTDCTNNVMNSQNGLGATGNDIDPTYTYDDSAIKFTMDGDYPELFTTSMGVNFVKANGSSVYAKASAAVAPDFDIAGNARAASPSVGAYEASADPASGLNDALETSVGLYPNPVQDVLYVGGAAARLSVYNVAGQLVRSYQVENNQVDVASLATGMYIVNVINAEGVSVGTERLMKK